MRIVSQHWQTILMNYHALLFIFEKAAKFYCLLLQIIGGALWANSKNTEIADDPVSLMHN